ncbi:hypothetical protein CU044_2120 [Streptomyces sp. L-9-10]|uniref:hypothetical protein n=1 Tax=Streptomyces sp. L-9-10 TaxID=1478131 RepID=UPI00101BC5F5|nr:hypothetical protein [Streptomyces sp. L-9-10]RYJ29379.1 hypothetical protein CU044_2120 [Streptomyces sp. L-9-10]
MSTQPAPVEYLYGIDSTVDDDSTHYQPPRVVKFRIIKKTPKRVYYEINGWTRFVDRQRLEADGKVLRLSGGWWEPDLTVYLSEPVIHRPQAPSLSELKAAMTAAHPDRGGTDDAFTAAFERYERARSQASR